MVRYCQSLVFSLFFVPDRPTDKHSGLQGREHATKDVKCNVSFWAVYENTFSKELDDSKLNVRPMRWYGTQTNPQTDRLTNCFIFKIGLSEICTCPFDWKTWFLGWLLCIKCIDFIQGKKNLNENKFLKSYDTRKKCNSISGHDKRYCIFLDQIKKS